MTQLRITVFAALTLVSGLFLTACPRPNGYTAVPAVPQANFDLMLGLYPIPGDGGHAVVLTKDGMIYRVSLVDPNEAPSTFLDLRSRLIPAPEQEEGLLGLAFAPDYTTSRRLYVYYSAGPPRRTVVSRFIKGASIDPPVERVILEIAQPYANHNGGPLAFGPDGMLYIGVGDGGSAGDPQRNGQNTNTLLGKILRIDVSGDAYSIPADNPFASGGGRGEVFAYGLRNPWRITFDRVTGQLWAGDVGQNEVEEVDRIVAGANYGWNIMEGNECYKDSPACGRADLLRPRAQYTHEFGCSVSGGYVYRGTSMPELDGWYVYGDFCSGRIWAVDIATNAGAAIPIADTNHAISSFGQDDAGEIYIVTFDNAIFKLARKPQ